MAKKTEVYVDTGAFISFLDRSDTHHPLFLRLFASPPSLATTVLVIQEAHAWFLKRYDVTKAIQFLSVIEDLVGARVLSVLPADRALFDKSVKLLRKYSDQPLTLADAAGLAIMTENKIKLCWSTDRHMSLTGVPLVIHFA